MLLRVRVILGLTRIVILNLELRYLKVILGPNFIIISCTDRGPYERADLIEHLRPRRRPEHLLYLYRRRAFRRWCLLAQAPFKLLCFVRWVRATRRPHATRSHVLAAMLKSVQRS